MSNLSRYAAIAVAMCVAVSCGAASLLDPVGSFSGDCVTGFSFSGGDPVLGSIAIAQQSIACVTKQGDKTVANILEEGGFNKSLDDVVEPGTSTLTLGTIGGRSGQCPANGTATVFGREFVVETQPMCDLAGVMGWFVLLSAVVAAAKILAGGD